MSVEPVALVLLLHLAPPVELQDRRSPLECFDITGLLPPQVLFVNLARVYS